MTCQNETEEGLWSFGAERVGFFGQDWEEVRRRKCTILTYLGVCVRASLVFFASRPDRSYFLALHWTKIGQGNYAWLPSFVFENFHL